MRRRTFGAALSAATFGLVAGALPSASQAGAATTPALSAVQVQALSRNDTHSVIVVFKDQVPSLPANTTFGAERQTAVGAVQSQVVGELRQLHAPGLHSYTVLNAVSADVSSAEEIRLAANPAVAEVVPNATAQLEFNAPGSAVEATAGSAQASPGLPAHLQWEQASARRRVRRAVELDPQALQTIRANSNLPGAAPTAASLGITGAGVKVAFIAEGIDVDQPNFQRANGSQVIVDQKPTSPVKATPARRQRRRGLPRRQLDRRPGQRRVTALLCQRPDRARSWSRAPPRRQLVWLKAFPSNHDATTTSLLEAIDYAVTVEHVNVLNESFGYNPLPDTMNDLIRQADEAAVAAGTVVDVSTGDAGPTSTRWVAEHRSGRDRRRGQHHVPGVRPGGHRELRRHRRQGLGERQPQRSEQRRHRRSASRGRTSSPPATSTGIPAIPRPVSSARASRVAPARRGL